LPLQHAGLLVPKLVLAWGEAGEERVQERRPITHLVFQRCSRLLFKAKYLALDEGLGAEGKQGMRPEICQSFSSLSLSLGVLIFHSCRFLGEQAASRRRILPLPFAARECADLTADALGPSPMCCCGESALLLTLGRNCRSCWSRQNRCPSEYLWQLDVAWLLDLAGVSHNDLQDDCTRSQKELVWFMLHTKAFRAVLG